jgi:hypothetical protein
MVLQTSSPSWIPLRACDAGTKNYSDRVFMSTDLCYAEPPTERCGDASGDPAALPAVPEKVADDFFISHPDAHKPISSNVSF